MDDLPRQKLCELIDQYGRSLCDDPRRCEALLRDYCGQYKREIFVLMSALRAGVPEELGTFQDSVPHTVLIARLQKRLHDNLGLAEEFARWAVESWGLALGVISPLAGPDESERGPSQQATPEKPAPAQQPPSSSPQRAWSMSGWFVNYLEVIAGILIGAMAVGIGGVIALQIGAALALGIEDPYSGALLGAFAGVIAGTIFGIISDVIIDERIAPIAGVIFGGLLGGIGGSIIGVIGGSPLVAGGVQSSVVRGAIVGATVVGVGGAIFGAIIEQVRGTPFGATAGLISGTLIGILIAVLDNSFIQTEVLGGILGGLFAGIFLFLALLVSGRDLTVPAISSETVIIIMIPMITGTLFIAVLGILDGGLFGTFKDVLRGMAAGAGSGAIMSIVIGIITRKIS